MVADMTAPGEPPASAVEMAQAWVDQVVDHGNLEKGWFYCHPALRTAWAQAWFVNTGRDGESDAEALVEALVERGAAADLWPGLATWLLEQLRSTGISAETWGASTRTRPVPPDMEAVWFMDTGGQAVLVDAPSAIRPFPLLMHFDADRGAWRLISFGGMEPPVPGWPPLFPGPLLGADGLVRWDSHDPRR